MVGNSYLDYFTFARHSGTIADQATSAHGDAGNSQFGKTQAVRTESESTVKSTYFEPAVVPNPTM